MRSEAGKTMHWRQGIVFTELTCLGAFGFTFIAFAATTLGKRAQQMRWLVAGCQESEAVRSPTTNELTSGLPH